MVRFRNRDGTGATEYRYLVEDVDRHGNVRLYVRRHGRKVRLRETPGTPEFQRAYQDAVNGRLAERPVSRVPAAPGSLHWLCMRYYGSASFKLLDPRTQSVRKRILDGLCREHGTKPVASMKPRHVRRLRDARADKPEAANALIKALRQVFKFAVGDELVASNPAAAVEYLSTRSSGFHSWTPDEVTQFEARHPVGTKARLALALLLYTGQRRSDVVQLGPQQVREGWLTFTQFKGRHRNPTPHSIPILPELRAIIDATPSGDLAYLVTEFGKPFTANGFGNWFRKRCDEAGLPHCTAHGLRKAGAAIAAENGATERQLMAIFGWQTMKEAARYTKAARQKVLAGAGMRLLVTDQKSDKSVPLSGQASTGGTNLPRNLLELNG